jgi:hypothetical protein
MSSSDCTPENFEKKEPLLWSLLMKILSCSEPIKIMNDSIKSASVNPITNEGDIGRIRLKYIDKMFLCFLFNLKKLVKTCNTLPIPPTTVYDTRIIFNCGSMKLFNTFIVKKEWKAPQDFLRLIDIPVQKIYRYQYAQSINLRLFPHISHVRPIKRVADALSYAPGIAAKFIAETSRGLDIYWD